MTHLKKAGGGVNPRTWKVDVTLFDHAQDNVPKRVQMPFGDLIRPHIRLPDKLKGPAFSPAIFLEKSKRSNESVVSVNSIVFDYDYLSPSQWMGVLALAEPFAFFWWTTHSHGMKKEGKESGRYRLVLIPDRTIYPNEFLHVRAVLSEMFGHLDDWASTKDIQRIWFLPAAPKSRLNLAVGPEFHTGLPVEVDAILATDAPKWLEPSNPPGKETGDRSDEEFKPRKGAVPMADVLRHYDIGHPLHHINCPFPDHADNRPSFRVTGDFWICNCGPDGRTTGGGTDKLIYRMEGGPRDYSDQEMWQRVWKIVEELGGARPGSEIIEEFNTKHAIVILGGKSKYLFERPGGSAEFWEKETLKDWYAGDFATVATAKGNKRVNTALYWLKHPDKRRYDRVVFQPGRGVAEKDYNLWQGFAFEPKKGPWNLFRLHLREVVANGDMEVFDYLLNWMAHAVQRPWELPEVAIVLRGLQGTGKSMVWKIFGSLFGPHYIVVNTPGQLAGRFNMHLADKVIVFAEEAFFAGDRKATSSLKARITEPFLAYEAKGRDIVQLPNFSRIVCSSNEDWVVPAAMDERRWCVLDVSDEHKEDTEYFQALTAQMNQGGLSALLYALLEHNIERFNPRVFPRTAALDENIEASMDPIQAWWYEKLHQGFLLSGDDGWLSLIPIRLLYDDLHEFVGHHPRRVSTTDSAVARALKQLCPGLVSKPVRISGEVRRHIEFPDLAECRHQFESATRYRPEWPTPKDPESVMAEWAKNGQEGL